MNIDFETPHLVLCIKNYYGTMEDGREFTIISHSNYGSVWIEDIETGEKFLVVWNECDTIYKK